MVNFEDFQSKKEKICVVGLGYVGLPLAVLLSKKFDLFGFDISDKKIAELQKGHDRTGEVGEAGLKETTMFFTADPKEIKNAKFIIVAVPTPVDEYKKPDLSLVESATRLVGQNLSSSAVVVYESTVYPGVTEEICLPILEKESGLKGGVDFKIGYSPERVNPGDKEHTINKIIKVVAGMDEYSLNLIDKVYNSITEAGTFRATSIKVAEAAKVIENTQRDLNIALMNELAIIFNKMGFSIYDVLEAAGTKWNFLKFQPGMVGGHCIGVDPYYLTYKAENLGYNSEVISAGRRMNDSMPKYIAHQITKAMSDVGSDVRNIKVAIFGFTFKEDIPDVRNSKIVDLYQELVSYGVKPLIYDPHADKKEVENEYGIELCNKEDLKDLNVIIVAVPHKEFKSMSAEDFRVLMSKDNLLIADVKRIFKKDDFEKLRINYWSL